MFRVQWHITERCNLKCIHCYQDEHTQYKEMSLEKLKKTADSVSVFTLTSLNPGAASLSISILADSSVVSITVISSNFIPLLFNWSGRECLFPGSVLHHCTRRLLQPHSGFISNRITYVDSLQSATRKIKNCGL